MEDGYKCIVLPYSETNPFGPLKRKCKLCEKTLVPIGTDRKGGKQSHSDWLDRKYHKKCWKKIQERIELLDENDRWTEEKVVKSLQEEEESKIIMVVDEDHHPL